MARGPKPVAALREMNVPITLTAPEPNTWHEVLQVTAGRPEKRIGVQEYGKRNVELLDALKARGAEVTPVRVYEWDLPHDTIPLREAAKRLATANVDVIMFTTSIQIAHLMQLAAKKASPMPSAPDSKTSSSHPSGLRQRKRSRSTAWNQTSSLLIRRWDSSSRKQRTRPKRSSNESAPKCPKTVNGSNTENT